MSRTLLKGVMTIGANTMVSRVLGFVRDVILARAFGASALGDAFFVAFRIPNLFRRLFGEGAFSQAFIPVLGEYKATRSDRETQDFVDDVTGWLSLALVVVTALGMLAAPWVVMVIAPGFSAHPDKFALTVELLRITFPYLFFISLTALAGGILNTYGKFSVPAFTPVFLNLAMIFAALVLAPWLGNPAVAVAWGVFLGGLVQLLFQVPFLRQIGRLPRPRLRRRDPGVAKVLKLMGPAIFGSSVAQLNLFLSTILASFLATGSVSYLYYSDRLVEFPLGVFGVALGTVVLPALSQQQALQDHEHFNKTLDWALRLVLIIGIPATVGLLVLGQPLLISLFRYGAFDMHAVEMSQRSLIGYGLGIVPIIAVRVLAPAFYARQNTRTPVKIAVVALIANMVFSLLLIWPLAHAGLALATSLAAVVNAMLLYLALRRASAYAPRPGWVALVLKVIAASALMGVALYWLQGEAAQWLTLDMPGRLLWLAGLVSAGMAIFFVAAWLLAIPELRQLLRRKKTHG
ncbi:murein biosynthesis integral membrane protein MurJ [Thermithiobacillus tepidarius]|uniref:murein biosynthesis integral membrane protein MurJ n=1 Tax=Thermithiobacillus tepidarius TaxID=929 RepID=UPI00048B19E3|nr:murein biosynthesis integral membrane protein MurJ [Thermithiobacillus tepidarius]